MARLAQLGWLGRLGLYLNGSARPAQLGLYLNGSARLAPLGLYLNGLAGSARAGRQGSACIQMVQLGWLGSVRYNIFALLL